VRFGRRGRRRLLKLWKKGVEVVVVVLAVEGGLRNVGEVRLWMEDRNG
jgi:hypothetical protein